MGYELEPSGVGLLFSLVRTILSDWESHDLRRYFELAYRDSDMELYVKTDSAVAGRIIAQGVADMMAERMKVLKAREDKLLES